MEMKPESLYSTVGGCSSVESVVSALRLQAEGLGFNDSATRVGPSAHIAKVTIPQPTQRGAGKSEGRGERGGNQGGSQGGIGRRWENVTCHKCGQKGHIQRNCPDKSGEPFTGPSLSANMGILQDIQRTLASLSLQQSHSQYGPSASAASYGHGSTESQGGWRQPGGGGGGQWGPPASTAPPTEYLWPRNPSGEAPSAFTLHVDPSSGTDGKWMHDSGANVHMVSDISLLHSPRMLEKPIPLKVAVHGPSSGVIAMGDMCLLNEAGDSCG